MSEERKKLIRCLGADLVLTPAAESLAGAVARGARCRRRTPASCGRSNLKSRQSRVHYEETAVNCGGK
jgi:cysteine synthase A